MKCLTVCQPFASLIANPPHVKRVENRRWATGYTGPLAIHAGKSRQWLDCWPVEQRPDPMPFGALVAVARLVGCVHIDAIRSGRMAKSLQWLRDHEHAEGPWCWVLRNIKPLPEPIRCGGRQGLWTLSPEQERAVQRQLGTNRT